MQKEIKMSESSSLAGAPNRPNTLPEGPVSQYLDQVRSALEASGLTETQQIDALADHFVGSTLRMFGATEGYRRILAPMDDNPAVGDGSSPTTSDGEDWFRIITREGGARRAVVDIASLPIGWEVINRVGRAYRIESTRQLKPIPETITMASMDQLKAYLETDTPASGAIGEIERASMWEQTILDEIGAFLAEPYRKGAWDASDNLGSDVGGVRRGQANWLRAATIARRAGVDIDLIARSAEFMKRAAAQGQRIGTVALLNVPSGWGEL